jgi:hypothetical protein
MEVKGIEAANELIEKGYKILRVDYRSLSDANLISSMFKVYYFLMVKPDAISNIKPNSNGKGK